MVRQYSERSDHDVPSSLKKDLSEVNAGLAWSISSWMKKRGKAVRPKLTEEQEKQLQECFELMDQDSSGAINTTELGAAFKLLGFDMSKAEIEELLSGVDDDTSGEVEYAEFLQIMTGTLQRITKQKEEGGSGKPQVPFALVATAYRRKRLMEGIITGNKEVQAQITALNEKQQEAALAAGRSESDAPENRRKGTARSPQIMHAISAMTSKDLHKALTEILGPDEMKVIDALAVKSSKERKAAVTRSGSASRSTRRYEHYSQSPAHRSILQTPQTFDLKFSKPTVPLPRTASGTRPRSTASATSAVSSLYGPLSPSRPSSKQK